MKIKFHTDKMISLHSTHLVSLAINHIAPELN